MGGRGGRGGAQVLAAQPICRLHRPLRQGAVLLSVSRLAHRVDLHRLPPRQFALRNGDPGLAIERPPHARDRISDLPLSARPLPDRPHHVRPCGRPARHPHRIHQPPPHAFEPPPPSPPDHPASPHRTPLRSPPPP